MFNNCFTLQRPYLQSPFNTIMVYVANILALVATLIGAPILYKYSQNYAYDIPVDVYGSKWVALWLNVWFFLTYPLVFFLLRATLVTALIGVLVALGTRYGAGALSIPALGRPP